MRTVKLQFFKERGTWGTAPVAAISNRINSFDPFWHGIGIFHDVFEHYFEYKDPHFQGEYAQNIAGEIAATGATVYFNHMLKLSTRSGMNLDGWSKMSLMGLFRQTGEMMGDTVVYGRTKFGKELLTALPEQPLTNYNFIETLAQFHLDTINSLEFDPAPDFRAVIMGAIAGERGQSISKKYIDSITLPKLQSLYRWGYNQAQKEVPNTLENSLTLKAFIDFWETISRVYPAKDMAEFYKYLEFTVEPGPLLTWNANFITHSNSEVPYNKALDLHNSEFIRIQKELTQILKQEEQIRRYKAEVKRLSEILREP